VSSLLFFTLNSFFGKKRSTKEIVFELYIHNLQVWHCPERAWFEARSIRNSSTICGKGTVTLGDLDRNCSIVQHKRRGLLAYIQQRLARL
jgi:hypothetical protein